MKNLPILRSICLILLSAPLLTAQDRAGDLPSAFDLRTVGGVTPIKRQQGGTCWAHGTMAAIESNLLVSGVWKKIGDGDVPSLSEYHLDWWNGFNQHKNNDHPDAIKDRTGLNVHFGGDYRVSAAYISRGDGVVGVPLTDKKAIVMPALGIALDPSSYRVALGHIDPRYQRYYVRDIEWFTIGDNLENIDAIKRRVISQGAVGTAMAVNKGLMAKDFVHYQPLQHTSKPNHAIAIVGWDDDKVSADPDKKLPKPGCWLIKNSWGVERGDKGYYWISYYDKVCCRDPEMGAVSFRNVESMKYSHVYYHDYHGWRDTMKDVAKAFNLFTASANHRLSSLSFYTAADDVRYTAKIYSRFEKGELQGLRATKSGTIQRAGFHTVDLDAAVDVKKGETFIICLELSRGGQAFDRTSEIEVLLQPKGKAKQPAGPKGPNGGPIVISKANPGESFYHDGTAWRDLYEHRFDNPKWATFDKTANFCMKALIAK
ncbi:MAG: hypothetical protein EXR98_05755 [Gemmataceae bacterium]|nr:hypothetical protein [Gemmataceae bacterium]